MLKILTMQQPTSSLFVHMGPGMTAEAEKLALSAAFPHVEFWNQPAITEPRHAYSQLCDAVKNKIESMATSGRKINIIAHCFGGHLVKTCLESHSQFINECQFLANNFYLKDVAARLLYRLSQDEKTPPELKNEIKEFLKSAPQPFDFWQMFSLINKDTDFWRLYWRYPQNYKKYQKFVHHDFFDGQTFVNVVTDFIAHPPEAKESPFHGPITFYSGINDIFIDQKYEHILWAQIFPQIRFVSVNDAGHFPHLECSLNFI